MQSRKVYKLNLNKFAEFCAGVFSLVASGLMVVALFVALCNSAI